MRRLSQEFIELITVLVLAGIPYTVWMIGQTYALPMPNRSVTISSSTPSATVSDNFQMTLTSTSDLGSITFEYCSNSPLITANCDAPTGLSVSSAYLANQTGNTGFSIDSADSNANTLVIGRTASTPNDVSSSYMFNNIVNPSVSNQTVYVRITTYSTSDGTGSYLDYGATAFATTNNLSVNAYIPPFLNFCVGITVAEDCSQEQGDSIDLGTLSPVSTSTATSQMAAATNSVTGYSVFVIGPTMTSGNNVIPAVGNQFTSRRGTSEFGINLRQNNDPSVGSDPIGDGTAIPAADYNTPNFYSFSSGSQLASSSLPTQYNRMTVSYVVNVAGSQPAGIYNTSLTYLASAQF